MSYSSLRTLSFSGMKILRHDSSRLGCAATQSPTSRLPSTPGPVVVYDGGRRSSAFFATVTSP